MTSVKVMNDWKEMTGSRLLWSTTLVSDHIQAPGFDLPCQVWSMLSWFQTGQDQCVAYLHK